MGGNQSSSSADKPSSDQNGTFEKQVQDATSGSGNKYMSTSGKQVDGGKKGAKKNTKSGKQGSEADELLALAKSTPDGDKKLVDAALADLEARARPLTKEEFAKHCEGVEAKHEGAPVDMNKNKPPGPVSDSKGNNRDMRAKHGVQQPASRSNNH